MSDLGLFDKWAFRRQPRPRAAIPSPDGAPPQGFSPSQTQSYGCPIRLHMRQCVVGLGTTAGRVANRSWQLLARELGEVPRSVACLGVDADSASATPEDDGAVIIGDDGAGTNPHMGYALFLEHWIQIRDALFARLDPLFEPDPVLPVVKTAREATCFTVVAGPGGTSTGCLDPMISLIWEVGRRRSIQELRIRVLLLGPEMAINDLTRSVPVERADLIRGNFAESAGRMYRLMDGNARSASGNNGAPWRANSRSPRVFSLDIADQSNGQADFAVTDEFVEMVARAVFFQRFTHAGLDFDARYCDHLGIGNHTPKPY